MNSENKGSENKRDKNEFQKVLQLAEFGAKRLEERRSVEFRIFISYITLLVLALYQLIKQQNPIHNFFEFIKQQNSISFELWEGIIYGLALIMHTIYVIWQIGISIAMDNDSYRRNFYLEAAEDISGHRLRYDHENPNSGRRIIVIKHYWQQFLHLGLIWKDWSRLLLVGIPTILFIIIVDLFVKKSKWNLIIFNCWNLTIYYRILLSLMPILILLVGAWIAKRIKKNGEKIDIDETKSTASN